MQVQSLHFFLFRRDSGDGEQPSLWDSILDSFSLAMAPVLYEGMFLYLELRKYLMNEMKHGKEA
jgi:hypothetical protein